MDNTTLVSALGTTAAIVVVNRHSYGEGRTFDYITPPMLLLAGGSLAGAVLAHGTTQKVAVGVLIASVAILAIELARGAKFYR